MGKVQNQTTSEINTPALFGKLIHAYRTIIFTTTLALLLACARESLGRFLRREIAGRAMPEIVNEQEKRAKCLSRAKAAMPVPIRAAALLYTSKTLQRNALLLPWLLALRRTQHTAAHDTHEIHLS